MEIERIGTDLQDSRGATIGVLAELEKQQWMFSARQS